MALVYRELHVECLGLVAYGPMLALQEQRHQAVASGRAADTLFVLQHRPVVTTGRNPRAEHVLLSQAELAARGIDYCETGRGGDVTYHGPGQLVGYPIVQLAADERDIKGYVYRLEEILIRTAADFGVEAGRVAGLRGIWVGAEKLAAIGVRLAAWTTLHGFALNVSIDPADFGVIVPCGLVGRGVTSLGRLLGTAPPFAAVQERIIAHTAAVLGRTAVAVAPTPAPRYDLGARVPPRGGANFCESTRLGETEGMT